MKVCVTCGNPLTGRQQRHCSPLCASKAFNAKRVADGRLKEQRQNQRESRKAWSESAKEKRDCANCGETWLVSRYSDSQTCSEACGSERRLGYCKLPLDHPVTIGITAKRRAAHIANAQARAKERAKEREAISYKNRRVWVMGQCKRCGESFTAEWMCSPILSLQPQFCSERCCNSQMKDNRRAAKRKAFVAPVYRIRIFERDGWTCQLCNEPVDRLAKVPDSLAPTLDHILPLAKGGTHEPSNTQCAHFICNSIKGDRVAKVA
jgi:predicted nucleic acid-binding Zn ribbon protein